MWRSCPWSPYQYQLRHLCHCWRGCRFGKRQPHSTEYIAWHSIISEFNNWQYLTYKNNILNIKIKTIISLILINHITHPKNYLRYILFFRSSQQLLIAVCSLFVNILILKLFSIWEMCPRAYFPSSPVSLPQRNWIGLKCQHVLWLRQWAEKHQHRGRHLQEA